MAVLLRIVLDTNIVASGLLWDGVPARMIDAGLSGKVALFTSRRLLAELTRILRRPKFATAIGASDASVEDFVLGYAEIAAEVTPASISPVITNDPDDDHVLACALAAQADLIVSGDSDLLNLKRYQGIEIVTAAAALARVNAAATER